MMSKTNKSRKITMSLSEIMGDVFGLTEDMAMDLTPEEKKFVLRLMESQEPFDDEDLFDQLLLNIPRGNAKIDTTDT
jgi:hypothetical protein